MKSLLPTLAAIALAPSLAAADEAGLRKFADTRVAELGAAAVLIDAIRAQNHTTEGYSDEKIHELDEAWKGEVGHSPAPTIDAVMHNAASDYLRQQVAAAGGTITEVFVMDARGLNVAASDVTSDYWQGDEDKHSHTYGAGPRAVHISEIAFDESSQRYQAQISMTVTDPDSGAAIGAITVGVDAEASF